MKILFHLFGQPEEMEGPTYADMLVMYPPGGLRHAVVLRQQNRAWKGMNQELRAGCAEKLRGPPAVASLFPLTPDQQSEPKVL